MDTNDQKLAKMTVEEINSETRKILEKIKQLPGGEQIAVCSQNVLEKFFPHQGFKK